MKHPTKIFRQALGSAALAVILATQASAHSPSWPTPPAQVEGSAAPAESGAAPQNTAPPPLSAGRLAQMLAPIALYPDDLLAEILMAATYPLDVAEAARWLQDPQNAALKGDGLFAALRQKPWDPSVKALTPFPQVLRALDANLEWTEQLGEAYLADPAAVMGAVQGLRRRAQAAGRLLTTPQEIVRAEPEPSRTEEPITIEPPGPEVVYVPICDPSFAYGPWPYPDDPPFFPAFAGETIGGCGWIGGPIVAPFWGFAVLNFRARHIDIDRKRLALFDRDREKDRELPPGEEWRHDPGHRGNVPYRDPALGARFGRPAPAANVSPDSGGRSTGPRRLQSPLPVSTPQAWGRAGPDGARPPLDGAARGPEEIRPLPEGERPPTAGVQPRSPSPRPALEGVDPTWDRAPAGPSLDPDAERRMLIDRWGSGRVPSNAVAPSLGGSRTSPPFGGVGQTRSVSDRRFLRPPLGAGALPYGGRGASAIGVQPFNGQGPQSPSQGMGASGAGRPGR